MALPIVLKAEFITIFVSSSPGSCFKSAICIQNSLERAPIILFSPQLKEGKIIHLFRLSLNSSSSPPFPFLTRRDYSIFFSGTFLFTGLRSGENTDVGRQRFDLSSTNSVRFSFALFQCQPYIFTLLCEGNIDRAFLL